MKPLHFMGSSKEDLRDFPHSARSIAGEELRRVQNGRMPSDFKLMPEVGVGTYEIRVRTGTEWRVMYVANRAEFIYVLHCFQKKTQQTSRKDIDLAKRRYKRIGKELQ